MKREEILEMMNKIMTNKGRELITDENIATRDANFRSLDFSELALRIENHVGIELSFDASEIRKIELVSDVLDFFEAALK